MRQPNTSCCGTHPGSDARRAAGGESSSSSSKRTGTTGGVADMSNFWRARGMADELRAPAAAAAAAAEPGGVGDGVGIRDGGIAASEGVRCTLLRLPLRDKRPDDVLRAAVGGAVLVGGRAARLHVVHTHTHTHAHTHTHTKKNSGGVSGWR